ncbi:MAG TPA: hypothetical protein DDW77_05075 [Verrucomicrobiales bacterium]|nr:hypothetical protein [Pedosphaera sp.]HBF02513.1 hypothetical protein [Verrucomicrobiales bacterium]
MVILDAPYCYLADRREHRHQRSLAKTGTLKAGDSLIGSFWRTPEWNEDALSGATHGESHKPCATPRFTPEKSKIRRVRFHRDMDTRVCQKMNCELTEPRIN